MRATLADTTLARQAGRFVWLELNFDERGNRAFLLQHQVAYTPTLFVLDPVTESAVATHLGGMTAADLERFLDDGTKSAQATSRPAARVALARGDACLGSGRIADAIAAYRNALAQAPPNWADRPRAIGQLTWALMAGGQSEACAETAAVEAPRMPRGGEFVRVVLVGLSAANDGHGQPWADGAWRTLEPLSTEALALPGALRDHRFQIYQQLMHGADARGDSAEVERWSKRWLDELDATHPANDDERSALDIARVDAVVSPASAARVAGPLAASERAMPGNYNPSLRLAQVLLFTRRLDEALAACDRGLQRSPGPLGRSWLLQTKARVLLARGDRDAARQALAEAKRSANAIVSPQNRQNNLRNIAQLEAQAGRRPS